MDSRETEAREVANAIYKLGRRLAKLETEQGLQPQIGSRALDFTDTPYAVTRYDDVLLVDTSLGAVTITLPAAANAKNWLIVVIKTDSGANAVTVDPAGVETINGSATLVFAAQYDVAALFCDGTQWIALYRNARALHARTIIWTIESTVAITSGKLEFENRLGETLTIIEVYLRANTGPTGADLIVDIHKNGTTIFTTQANRPRILAGATTGSTTTIDVPSWAHGAALTMDVDQVGSVITGAYLVVELTATLP